MNMKQTAALICLVGVCVFLASCASPPANTITITGEYIEITPDFDAGFAVQSYGTENATQSEENTVDLANSRVVAKYETTNEHGDVEFVEFASGNFEDGKVTLSGSFDVPTMVEISVDVEGFPPRPIRSVVAPNDVLEFVLVARTVPMPIGRLMTLGRSSQVLDSDRKFLISGDFSDMEQELTSFTASAVAIGQFQGDQFTFSDFGTVLMQDGRFELEAEISEPTVVRVMIQADPAYYAMANAIVEPGAEISVRPYGESANLLYLEGTGTHAEVIGKHESSPEYRELTDRFVEEFVEYQSQLMDSGGTEARPNVERKPAEYLLAEGCEHLVPEEVIQPLMVVGVEYPPYWESYTARNDIQMSSLENTALNDKDPMKRLVALELGAFGRSSDEPRKAVAVYDELANELSEDVVARRVATQRTSLLASIETAENNQLLQVGQMAPEFTLPDLDGTDVSLSGVLEKNEVVFVDFWASWCGPCIAAFPELKELYADYRTNGFEILAVSIDSTMEDWQQATDVHEIPWLNLGQIGDDSDADGTVSKTYGAQTIPKGYVLDKKGCIIGKDVFPDRLEEFLVAQYGMQKESSSDEPSTRGSTPDDMNR